LASGFADQAADLERRAGVIRAAITSAHPTIVEDETAAAS
jgi:hypothetical protein